MRAYQVVEALACSHDVHVLVVDQEVLSPTASACALSSASNIAFSKIPWFTNPWILARQALRHVLPGLHRRTFERPAEWIYTTRGRLARLSELFPQVRFEVVHIFRLYTYPFHAAFAHTEAPLRVQLDLDDLESETRRSLSAIHAASGRRKQADALLAEAERYERVEREVLPSIDRVFTASEEDRTTVVNRYEHADVRVLPNVLESRPLRAECPARDDCFTFLFVGGLHYFPNQDALIHLCDDVLPTLAQRARRPFRVVVVGARPPRSLTRRLGRTKHVEFTGWVPDVAPYYAAAHAALAPLRCGGGTRIKILEAFTYGVPVVSTRTGAAGIAAEHDLHCLLATNAEQFVDYCLRLMDDEDLGSRIACAARALVQERYAPSSLREVLQG